MADIKAIQNVTLTTSWQEVSPPDDIFFCEYIAVTTDGTPFEIRYATSGDVSYPVSLDLNTFPLHVTKNRTNNSDDYLFYVKGTAASVLSILYWRE
jgi:hypothetical protein